MGSNAPVEGRKDILKIAANLAARYCEPFDLVTSRRFEYGIWAGLTLQNANLFPSVEGPQIRLTAVHAKAHWHLADGSDVEILDCLDDHSRLLLVCDAFRTVKAADVMHSFTAAFLRNGFPAALLTDNSAVFSGKSRRGKVLLESELERLGITAKHSTPYHPQTCGKIERFHQTLKRYLVRQAPAPTITVLQAQLGAFRTHYNQRRPHRALHGATPLHAFSARLKAGPTPQLPTAHCRVRHDRVDRGGRVTLRYLSRLYHIGLGAEHRGQPVLLLAANKDIRVLAEDGRLIRALTLDPTRNHQPPRTPSWPPPRI